MMTPEQRETYMLAVGADGAVLGATPETYAYWLGVSYVTRDGAQVLGGMKVVRSTPLLTSEDITTAAEMIRAQHGFDRCVVLSVYPLAGE